MQKHSLPRMHLTRRGAALRVRQLLGELHLLVGSFPDLRDAFDADELPLAFILRRDSRLVKASPQRRDRFSPRSGEYRGRIPIRLGTLRGDEGARGGHAHVWRFGAVAGVTAEVRIRAGMRDHHRQGTVGRGNMNAPAPGSYLGPYEILEPIARGGMGQVYKARDARLNRIVALKVSVDEFDRRFKREARAVASLNHPHIASVYGLDESPSAESGQAATALVMELVEGEDLSQRIDRGAIPIDEAVSIATQIAEALEAAHEQGIIHRDLKPANIKIRGDGTVKVLDFGLAKAMDPPSPSATVGEPGYAMNSPTLTARATQLGVILGTAAYMAPEQARGKAVDRRADIWAFGVVLYEMLTGARAFPGDDITDTLAAVLRSEPEWNLLPRDLSPTLLTFLKRCLQKDPKQRIGDIHDVRLALAGAFDTAAPAAMPVVVAAPARPWWRRAVPIAAAVIVTAAAVGSAMWLARPQPPAAVQTEVQDLCVGDLSVQEPQVPLHQKRSGIGCPARDGPARKRDRNVHEPAHRPGAGGEGHGAAEVEVVPKRIDACAGRIERDIVC